MRQALQLSEGRLPSRTILHVVSALDNEMGGMVHAALNVCQMLVNRDVAVELVATADPADDLDYLQTKYSDVPCRLFERTRPHHYFNSRSLRQWLVKNISNYSLIHIHGIFSFPTLYACGAAAANSVPYLLQPHGSLDPSDLQKHRHAKRIYGRFVLRPLLKRASGILLTTDLEADRAALYGTRPAKMVAPLPVELKLSREVDKATARDSLSIPRDAQVVLFLGRYDHKKGLQFLVPALARLKLRRPKLWFLLAGSGTTREENKVDSLLDRFSLRDWTTTTGFVSGAKKESVFAASDIFALPSLYENFGITVVEALQARLGVVISTEVYISSLLQSKDAASVCDPSITSCSAALAELLDNPQKLREIADQGPLIAESYFSTGAAFSSLMSAYRHLDINSEAPSQSTEPLRGRTEP